jgi:hypothetical protein
MGRRVNMALGDEGKNPLLHLPEIELWSSNESDKSLNPNTWNHFLSRGKAAGA